MKTRWMAAALILAAAAFVPSADAGETTLCNAYITSLPYTITTQGHYCFDRNLSTAMTAGAAITVNANFVLLDLNNFKLGGGAAGLGTDTVGVLATDRSNLTIRNGNIRGFKYGIVVEGTNGDSATNIVIENNVIDGNTTAGILAVGKGVIVRDNLVSNTGGTTGAALCSGTTISGIAQIDRTCTVAGHSWDVVRNIVSDTVGAQFGIGIFPRATASSTAVENIIRGVSGANAYGIRNEGTDGVCKDNIVQGVAAAYVLCTLVGTTNYP